MTSEVQEGWRMSSLGEVARGKGEYGANVSKAEFDPALPRYVRITDISDYGNLIATSLASISHEDAEGYMLEEGDLLFARSGATVGKSLLYQADYGPCAFAGYLIRFRLDPTKIDPYFARNVVQSADYWDWIATVQRAQAQPNINAQEYATLPLMLPPLPEQRRIAGVLRSLDEAITANRAALDQVARSRSAILHTVFEEPLWEVVPLGELGSWQSGGTPSKGDDTKWGGDVPWVCPRDMKTPVIRQTHSTLTSLALGGSCKLVPKGTLMIVVRGMILAKSIPTATIAMDATFNQDIKAFRPNGRALPKFVQLCLQHQERQLLRVVNTATHGTKKLDTDTLLAVSVPLPDLKTQQALADAVSDLDFASVKYGEEHIRLSTIKGALQSDLLTGRVRVPA
jgi:hypothetical protein